MANGTFYVDGVNGSDANDGLSEANAKQTLSAGLGLFSGGGNILHVQATGNYTLTSTVTSSVAGDSTDGPNVIEGYTTTPGARDGRPTITTATDSVPLWTMAADSITLRHLKHTTTASTKARCIYPSADVRGLILDDCVFDGAFPEVVNGQYTTWFTFLNLLVINCDFRNAVTAIINGGGTRIMGSYFYNCESAWKRGAYPSNIFAVLEARANVVNGAAKASSRGFWDESNKAGAITVAGNSFYNLASDAIRFDQSSALYQGLITNNIFELIGAYAVNGNSIKPINSYVRNNFFKSVTSGPYQRFATLGGDVNLSGSPFTAPASHDFSLNNSASAGAAVRAAGWPGVVPFGTGYLDGGALQHQDSGGGGGGTSVYQGLHGIEAGV